MILYRGLLALTIGCAAPAEPPARPKAQRAAPPKTSSRPIVAAHNKVRAAVGVPPLQWSDPIAKTAQRWANRLARNGCKLTHSTNNRYGENLFAASAAVSPEHVVDNWASERADYNYARNKCRSVCGHYTQIVWAKSTRLGCASARCGNGVVWVCNYDPPGNFVGEKPY